MSAGMLTDGNREDGAQANHVSRYRRVADLQKSGISIDQALEVVCKQDDIEIGTLKRSLSIARAAIRFEQQEQLINAKVKGELENERLRRRVRRTHGRKVVETIGQLLDGERTAVAFSEKKDAFIEHSYRDPDLQKAGVEAFVKVSGLEVKPSPNQTLVNVSQSNTQVSLSSPGEGGDFEERISRLDKMRRARNHPKAEPIVDIESTPADPVEAPAAPQQKEEELWEF